MDKETHSSTKKTPQAEEKAIDPTVCELCGATADHVEIWPIGKPTNGQYRGLCAPHYSLLADLVKEIIYTVFFSEGLEVFHKRYHGGR